MGVGFRAQTLSKTLKRLTFTSTFSAGYLSFREEFSFCRFNLRIKDFFFVSPRPLAAPFTFRVKSLSAVITQSCIFMPLIISSPSLCSGGTQWVGASFLERCEVASSRRPFN